MKNRKTSDKIKYMRLCRVCLLSAFLFLALYIISKNSSFVKLAVIKYFCLLLMAVSYTLYVIFFVRFLSHKNEQKLGIKSYACNALVAVMSFACLYGLSVIYLNKDFKEWFVTKAMATMSHQYYCKIFYNDDIINEVMSENYIVEVDEEVDTSLINSHQAVDMYESMDVLDNMSSKVDINLIYSSEPSFSEFSTVQEDFKDEYYLSYANEFEEQIFKGHTKDEKYRLIRTTLSKQNAFLAVIYNPADVSVEVSAKVGFKGEYVVDMAQRTGAVIAINGGRFTDIDRRGNGGLPSGVTLSHGQIITNRLVQDKYGIIGINKDNILVLYKGLDANQVAANGVRDAVTSGPFLVVNGKSSYTKGNGGYGSDARTVIGQRADGIMLLLVVESNDARTDGATMRECADFMIQYGAINAANLDGGTSSVIAENGIMLNDPINSRFQHETRPVSTAFIVK